MSSPTGAAEGEDPKCLRHTWLRAKLYSSFTSYRAPLPPTTTLTLLLTLVYVNFDSL